VGGRGGGAGRGEIRNPTLAVKCIALIFHTRAHTSGKARNGDEEEVGREGVASAGCQSTLRRDGLPKKGVSRESARRTASEEEASASA